jgi:hypothetical protein
MLHTPNTLLLRILRVRAPWHMQELLMQSVYRKKINQQAEKEVPRCPRGQQDLLLAPASSTVAQICSVTLTWRLWAQRSVELWSSIHAVRRLCGRGHESSPHTDVCTSSGVTTTSHRQSCAPIGTLSTTCSRKQTPIRTGRGFSCSTNSSN